MSETPIQISYDDYSLQDDTVITADIQGDDSAPMKSLGLFSLPIDDGGKITQQKYESRRIRIAGKIKSPTVSGFLGKILEIKKVLSGNEKTLKLTYPDNQQRIYTASLEGSVQIERKPWELNIGDFSASFLCSKPWAVQTLTAISGVYGINDPITELSIGISGTASPQPTVYFNTTNSGTRFLLSNKTTNSAIEVATTFSGIGRQLIINTENGDVQLDGEDINFIGKLPKFSLGINNISVVVIGAGSGNSKDQYSENINGAALGSFIFGGNTFVGQVFSPNLDNIIYVDVYLAAVSDVRKASAENSALYVSIHADNSGQPGTILGTATIPEILSTSFDWYRAIFGTKINVTPGVTYHIVISAPNIGTTYAYKARYDASNPYPDGLMSSSSNGGSSYSGHIGKDLLFRTYGNLADLTGKMIVQYNPRYW